MNNINIISSEKNWLEQSAVDQLKTAASLPGVVRAVGLPDLHPGKSPVGAVIITEDIIYPHLVGNDIGCGMSLFATNIEKRKVKLERLVKKAEGTGGLRDIPLPQAYEEINSCSPLKASLGTIGGGNHFAELQEIDKIYDKDAFNKLGLDNNNIYLLIHSGSRSYGQEILDDSIKLYSAQKGLRLDSEAASLYLAKHDDATRWASVNRELIALRFLKLLGINSSPGKLIDSVHNSVTAKTIDNSTVYIHRKGAAPSDNGAVIIPGSRGSLTYLVKPNADTEISGYSLAHGAGRKWERGMCRARLENKYTKETIKTTKLKSRVICSENNLLYEEAPEAYKNIDTVIKCLLDYKLIEVIATLRPILTYKA